MDKQNDDLAKSFEEFASREADQASEEDLKKREKAEFSSRGNRAEAVVVSRTPKTSEEVLAQCGVDVSEWRIEYMKVKTWEVGMSPRATGQTGDWSRLSADPIVVQLFGYHLTLAKLKPEPVLYPEVQPIELVFSGPPPRQPAKRSGAKLAVIIPDIQTGFSRDFRTGAMTSFHDRRALDVAVQIAASLQPDVIVFNGDDLDLPDWSDKYVRSPEMYFTSQAAIAECAWWKAQFRKACPGADIHWIEGNHEARMMRAILVHNVSSYDLRAYDDLDGHAQMSIPKLCALDSMGITYHGPYPHGEVWLGDKFRIVHGETVRSQSGKTAAKMTEDLRHSEVQGHIHRVELACKTYWKRSGSRTYMAASFGTMAKIQPNAVPGFKSRQNWQNGFGVVEFEDDGECLYNVRPVLIFDGATVYGGDRWEARSEAEIVADIRETLQDSVRVA